MIPTDVHGALKRIGASQLHHANTVTTSCTFLEHGGLLSRGYVEDHRLAQTPQPSDAIDKKFGIWNGVFVDHVDIHYRAGRTKGPNQYGPVLFVLDLDVLLDLPPGSDVHVTRTNPIHWTSGQTDHERWFATVDDLAKSISFGDFDKMLVITTPNREVPFLNRQVQVALDDPQRPMLSGIDAYAHAEKRLKMAAEAGGVKAGIAQHICRDDCVCVAKYRSYGAEYFESRFA